MHKKIFQNVYFYLILLIVINILVATFYASPNFKIAGDAGSYHEAIRLLEGGKSYGPVPFLRLLTTPLMLFSARVADYFVNNIYASMATVNLIFYVLISFVFYKLAFEIYKDEKIAFLGSFFFISNYYLFNIDNAFIADMGGRFFFILTNFLAVKYFLGSEKKYYYLAIISSSAGVLFKEFGALGLLSLVFLIFLSKSPWLEKMKLTIKAGLLFSIIPALFHLFFFLKSGFSYLDVYNIGVNFYPPEMHAYGLSVFIKVMGWIFLAGWPLFLWGLYQEKKFFDKQRVTILCALLPASLAFFAWPMFMQRTAFILVPWLSLITGFGVSKIKNRYIVVVLLIFYLLINYNVERLLVLINLPF
jgi:hypothetical protein